MRISTTLLIAGLLALAGCGERAGADARIAGEGTKLRVGGSEFGRMLFDSRRQAIYVFARDRNGKSRCYGACADAWPPVFANGKPMAGRGVKAALLGTAKRRGGRRQVTYAGKPLYYYAHESPGEVLCHNVNLNGGFWWVVGPDGKRRP
jgi:predicted lipoprotein with Yx(FWY)xxD motif